MNQPSTKKALKNDHILTVLICSFTIPLSMSLWIINLIYAKVKKSDGFDGMFY